MKSTLSRFQSTLLAIVATVVFSLTFTLVGPACHAGESPSGLLLPPDGSPGIQVSVSSISDTIFQYYFDQILEYTVSATNLNSDLVLTVETFSPVSGPPITISLTRESGYGEQISIVPEDGTVDNTTIYVKGYNMEPDPPYFLGAITHSSTGAQDVVVPVDILVGIPPVGPTPVATIGNVISLPESSVLIPIHVTDFEYIGYATYVIVFNPQVMTFSDITNSYFGNMVYFDLGELISPTEQELEISIGYSFEGRLIVPDGEKLFDMVFTYHEGCSGINFVEGFYLTPWDPYGRWFIYEPFGDFFINGSVGPPPLPPVISVSLANNSSVTYNQMVTPPTPYQVSATNLTNDLVIDVTALSGFPEGCQSEISLLPNQAFSAQLVISPVNGMIDTTIYIMPNYGTPFYASCNLIHSSNNAETIIRRVTIENIFSYHFAPVVTIPDVHAIPGSLINIPVMVESFEDAGVGYYTIEFDPTVLTYSGLENVYPGLIVENCPDCNDPDYCLYQTDKICSEVTGIDPTHSRINIHYYHEAISPGMLVIPDGVTLFELTFNYSVGYSALTFTNGNYLYCGNGIPTDPVIINEPFENYYFNGSVGPFPKTVSLELNLEGLYRTADGIMTQAQGRAFPEGIADEITIGLAHSSPPHAMEFETAPLPLNRNGICTFEIPGTLNGNHYVVIKHRNSVETWSANPVDFSGNAISCNFTTSAESVFGNNLKQSGNKYCIYSGDINQDGIVDTGDITLLDNDASSFSEGYIVTDLNGDGNADTGDMTIIDNNASEFAGTVRP